MEDKFDTLYNSPKTIYRTGKSEAFKQQARSIFTQLQKIAEKRDEIIHILGKDNFLAWEAPYHDYVSKFEIEQNIEEKYQLTEMISNLLYRQDIYFKEKGYIGSQKYITDEEEKTYQQIQDEFNQIQ